MTLTFQCGHESKPENLEADHIKKAKYEEWKHTVGFDGDKSKCLRCFIGEK